VGAGVGAGVGTAPKFPMNRSLFGEKSPASLTLPVCASSIIFCATRSGFNVGDSESTRAATPDTCGHAMEVPLKVVKAVSLAEDAEEIRDPGAKMSTQLPILLKPDRLSSLKVMDATVMACGIFAGA